jgi:hypothetical protein
LETFRSGKTYRRATKEWPLNQQTEYFVSEPIFKNFLTKQEPFKSHFSINSLADNFYENVRCAILHEAATRNGWTIRVDTSSLIEIRDDFPVLNRVLFVEGIKTYLQNYKLELLGTKELKVCFTRKMDSICATS